MNRKSTATCCHTTARQCNCVLYCHSDNMRIEKEIKDELSRLEDKVKDAYLSHNEKDMVIFKNQVTCLEWVLGLRKNTRW